MPGRGGGGHLYTVLNVTENDISLYGFATEEQQTCFKLLTGVSGVGPKVGLAILSVMEPDRVYLAVSAGDHKAFKAPPSGVGPQAGPAHRAGTERQGSQGRRRRSRPRGPVRGVGGGQRGRQQPGHCGAGVSGVQPERGRRGHLEDRPCAAGGGRSSGWHCAEWQGGDKPCRNRRFTVQKMMQPGLTAADSEENSLRPQHLEDYVGQEKGQAEFEDLPRGGTPPGRGPWITCCSTARPAWARPPWPASSPTRWGCRSASPAVPAIEKPGDLAALLTNLQEGGRLVHRRDPPAVRQVEEVLYPALEDYALDIIIRQGAQCPEHPHQPAPLHSGGGPPPAPAS